MDSLPSAEDKGITSARRVTAMLPSTALS